MLPIRPRSGERGYARRTHPVMHFRLSAVQLLVIIFPCYAAADDASTWPPKMKVSTERAITVRSPRLLDVPEAVQAAAKKEGAAEFVVAKTPPTVELAFHAKLGPEAASRRLWSSWGDICVASDGRVYV